MARWLDVYFVNTDFKAKMTPEGWAEWGGRLKTSTYGDFGSRGESGSQKERIAETGEWTAEAASKLTVKAWLAGTDGWDPAKVR